MSCRCALLLALILAVGCGGSGPKTPPPPPLNPIPPAVAGPLGGSLATTGASLAAQAPQAALAAQVAALALQAGVQSNAVTLTSSLLAGSPSRAALTSGAAQAFGFQIQVQHLFGASSPQTFSGVLVFEDGANWILVAGPSPGSPIPPSVGTLVEAGKVWSATAGQEAAHLDTEGSACALNVLPPGVTSCKLATFSTGGFDVTGAAPSSGGATGSKTASIPNGPLSAGVSLMVDCNLGTLCPGGSGGAIHVAVTPAPVTVQVNAVQQFAAVVTGTTNQAVTWSVDEASGGTVDSTGRYTAPGSPGQFHVRATSQQDPTKSGFATVTVPQPAATVTITLSQPSVATLGSMTLTAQVTGSSNNNVFWSIEENSNGEFPAGKLSSTGPSATTDYAAPANPGTYHVRAIAQGVVAAPVVASVTVTPGCMAGLPPILPATNWFISSSQLPMHFDAQGRLLVAWIEYDEFGGTLENKAYVGRLENGGWTRLGGSGISVGIGAINIAMELDSQGNPVLAYSSFNSAASDEEIHVTKWNGSSWVEYPATIGSLDSAGNAFAMALGANSTPVLAVPRTLPSAPFHDLAIATWGGSSWVVTPGIQLSAADTVSNVDMITDASGDVTVTWDERTTVAPLSISHFAKKLTGPGAGLLGQPGNGADFLPAAPVLAFDASGALVMGWTNYPDGTFSTSDGFEVSVRGATSWSQVGNSLPGLPGVVVPERDGGNGVPHALVLNAHTGRLTAATLTTSNLILTAYGNDANGDWPMLCAPLQEPVTPGPLSRPGAVGLVYDPTSQDVVLAGTRFDRILLAHVH